MLRLVLQCNPPELVASWPRPKKTWPGSPKQKGREAGRDGTRALALAQGWCVFAVKGACLGCVSGNQNGIYLKSTRLIPKPPLTILWQSLGCFPLQSVTFELDF